MAILIGRGLDLRKGSRQGEGEGSGGSERAEAVESAKGRDGRFGRVNVCGSTRSLCSFEGAGRGSEREASLRKVSGDDSWRAPPVPIPNTEVKPPNADGTELGTAWESRKLPGSKRSGRNESFSRSQNIRKNGVASGSDVRSRGVSQSQA